ncbi:MAG: tetratricopeptide repeat protein [Bacteroidales bacterium]|nr:tetratricopeptide repeat protein [Bacteroidales bacterium]
MKILHPVTNIWKSIPLFCLLLILCASCGERGQSKNGDAESQDPVLAALNKKIKSSPNNASLYYQKGEHLLNNGSVPEALMNFVASADLDSTNVKTWSKLSDVYMLMENYIDAENAMVQVLKLDPDNEDAMLKLAKYYIIFFNYDDAKNYLDKALFKNNLNAQVYELYGTYYLEQGDTATAIGSFNRAVELDDNLHEAYLNLALLYDLRNNPVAIDYYRNVIRIRPNNLHAQYKLAYYLQEKSGRIDEAMEMYDAMLEKNPQYYHALYNKGYIYLVYKKNPRVAVDYFRQAVEVSDRKTPDALYNVAYCLELLDNKAEARRLYRQILELFHDYPLAIEGQRRVGRFDNSTSY